MNVTIAELFTPCQSAVRFDKPLRGTLSSAADRREHYVIRRPVDLLVKRSDAAQKSLECPSVSPVYCTDTDDSHSSALAHDPHFWSNVFKLKSSQKGKSTHPRLLRQRWVVPGPYPAVQHARAF